MDSSSRWRIATRRAVAASGAPSWCVERTHAAPYLLQRAAVDTLGAQPTRQCLHAWCASLLEDRQDCFDFRH